MKLKVTVVGYNGDLLNFIRPLHTVYRDMTVQYWGIIFLSELHLLVKVIAFNRYFCKRRRLIQCLPDYIRKKAFMGVISKVSTVNILIIQS